MAGQATRITPDVKTIAVPPFKNLSSTFHIEQQLTAAVTREFLERTHYRILSNPTDADAVLRGTVKEVRARAITFDVNTGLATSLQVQVTAEVKLEDIQSHKLLFSNSNYVYYEEYQVSETPSALFEEDKPALDRLSARPRPHPGYRHPGKFLAGISAHAVSFLPSVIDNWAPNISHPATPHHSSRAVLI